MDKVNIDVLPLYYDHVLTQNYPIVILVGGRNSGKSHFLQQLAIMQLHNKKKYKLLVIEDVETNIGEGVKAGILERAEEFGLDKVMSSTKQPAEIKHTLTGNNIIFKGYHSDAQQKQVKSLNEVTAVWYEESENITYNQFKALRMQLRGGNEEDRQLFLTMNPINSDGFINTYFFEQPPDHIIERFADGRPKVFTKNIIVEVEQDTVTIPCMVIVSVHWDNPYLTMEQRADIEELKQTDPIMHAMLSEGKFIKPAGTYFKEFSPGIHVVEPFPIPDHWIRYTSKDYGLDMLANYWIAIDTQNNAYVYKELYEPDLIISDAAKRIKEVNGDDKIHSKYAPPDLWNRRQETGRSAAEIFFEHGESLLKSSNDRVQGWLNVKEWLKVIDSKDEHTGEIIKTSRLKIFSNCVNLIRTIPKLQRDERNANDVANQPHEWTHGPDALRGFCITRPLVAVTPQERTQDDFGLNKPKVDPYRGGRIDDSYISGGW